MGEDLFQHLFEVLCEIEDEKLIDSYNKKYIKFLAIKIMSNAFHNKYSIFTKQFKRPDLLIFLEEVTYKLIAEDIEKIEGIDSELEDFNSMADFLNQEIIQDNFYKVTLLKRWISGESVRKISALTQIPYRTVAKEIQNTLAELKEQCL